MIIEPNADPIDLRSGIYKHYKGGLYQVVGYSHNASDDNNVQVLYISLTISPDKPGPRWSTRDWREFFETVCPEHDGMDAYSDEHRALALNDARREGGFICDAVEWKERFEYMGPMYYWGFES